MSSHREAPEISKDPTADNTDVYAFVSPDRPGYVTLIANYIPREQPDGGPNFYEFNDEVLYQIFVHNSGNPAPDITYQFRFRTRVLNPNTFLYNTGPISSITDPHWNRPQSYSVTRIDSSGSHVLASGGNSNLQSLPCNIGPRSTPNYTNLVAQAIHQLDTGEKVFAGQRREGFYVDLGAVFDLLDLRPFQNLNRFVTPNPVDNAPAAGVNSTVNNDIHSIVIQVPISMLTRDGSTVSGSSGSISIAPPLTVGDSRSVIGVWASADRQRITIRGLQGAFGTHLNAGPFVQISRLANPLFNELLIQMVRKDFWNTQMPSNDAQFLSRVQYPEVASLLVLLYPAAFPHLATITPPEGSPPNGFPPRADLQAILLSGLPPGIIPGFQNYTGPNLATADLIRLNMAVPAVSMANANPFGLIGGDAAGFPNGRRVYDDTTTIELRAIAGLTYPLVAPSYTPDAAAGRLDNGGTTGIYDVVPNPKTPTPQVDFNILYNHDQFPYLGTPLSGYDVQYVTSTNSTG